MGDDHRSHKHTYRFNSDRHINNLQPNRNRHVYDHDDWRLNRLQLYRHDRDDSLHNDNCSFDEDERCHDRSGYFHNPDNGDWHQNRADDDSHSDGDSYLT